MVAPKRDRRATKNLPWAEWLTVFFGKLPHENADLIFAGPRACDRSLIHAAITAKGRDEHGGITVPSLLEELEARGYDVSTLEFRIRRKPTDGR